MTVDELVLKLRLAVAEWRNIDDRQSPQAQNWRTLGPEGVRDEICRLISAVLDCFEKERADESGKAEQSDTPEKERVTSQFWEAMDRLNKHGVGLGYDTSHGICALSDWLRVLWEEDLNAVRAELEQRPTREECRAVAREEIGKAEVYRPQQAAAGSRLLLRPSE